MARPEKVASAAQSRDGREVTYDVRIWKARKVTGKRGPAYQVRWGVGNHQRSRTFRTSALAESFRADLRAAANRGEAFDTATGLPVSMVPGEQPQSTGWWSWALQYVDLKWPTLAPTSRRSTADGLAAATMALAPAGPARPPDAELRAAMLQWAFNGRLRSRDVAPQEHQRAVLWLEKHLPALSALEDPATARQLLDVVIKKQDGAPAAPTTIARRRAILFNVLELAVEYRHLPANPLSQVRWSAPKVNDSFDPRSVVNPSQARQLLAAVATINEPGPPDRRGIRRQRHGRHLTALFGLMYYAALRPSEATALTEADLSLPPAGSQGDGWGQLLVSRSNPEISRVWTDEGKRSARALKHRAAGAVRPVPCPPALVELLRAHLTEFGVAADGRLFRGPNGGHIMNEHYTDVWQEARTRVLTPAQLAAGLAARPYDLRHSAVSTWLAAGVDSTQVARWAGHSVAVLHRVYAHVISGREDIARRRIDSILGDSESGGPTVDFQ